MDAAGPPVDLSGSGSDAVAPADPSVCGSDAVGDSAPSGAVWDVGSSLPGQDAPTAPADDSPAAAPPEPTPPEAADVFGPGLGLAEAYVGLLATTGVEWGLIGPREAGRLWQRHILNSLAVSRFIPDAATVADVGSGAGLPGIPLALARPDLRITLIESLERRVKFLELVVAELGIGDRVRVVRDRAETHTGFYDVVTCRAVARLDKLLGWTVHLFSPGGRLLALKGESAFKDLAAAASELRRRRLSGRVETVHVTPDADPTWVIVVR